MVNYGRVWQQGIVIGLLAVLVGEVRAQVIGMGSEQITLSNFHSFQTDGSTDIAPTDMVQMPDGRFLVATLGGSVRMLDSTGNFISTLLGPAETGTTKVDVTHYGMTSLALHPQFSSPDTFGYGKAYAMVTQQPQSISGVAADFTVPGSNPTMSFTNQDVVREYDLSAMLDSGVNSFVGQAVTARDIWRIDSPQSSHNAFDIVFRSNGDMFISSGDGGFTELTGDFRFYDRKQGAQNLDVAYGKILRINPDPSAYATTGGKDDQYSIPGDNPFVGTAGALAEIYANGVRSPYRLNLDPFDPTEETLWLGDVGAGAIEEVSKVTKGANLGWGRFEGTRLHNGNISIHGNNPIPPEFEYSHSPRSLVLTNGKITTYNEEAGGNSITGGHLYRGTLLGPQMQGVYIGANLGHHAGNPLLLPRLFYGDPDSASRDVSSFRYSEDSQHFIDTFMEESDFVAGFDFEAAGLTPGYFDLPQLVLSIAEDNAGELYVLGVDFNGLATISKLRPVGIPGDVDGMNGVTIDDFNIIFNHLGQSVPSREFGDLTNDQRVDLADFQRWRENAPPELVRLALGGNEVCEPSSLALACLLGLCGCGGVRRRGRRSVAAP